MRSCGRSRTGKVAARWISFGWWQENHRLQPPCLTVETSRFRSLIVWGWCREWELVAASSGRARENCNSEDHPRVESVHTRHNVVRGANDLLTQLRRQGWAVLHGLFDACGNRVPLSDP